MAKSWRDFPSRQPDRWNAYQREYRRAHPATREKQRGKDIAKLEGEGYIVIPPAEPEQEADSEQDGRKEGAEE